LFQYEEQKIKPKYSNIFGIIDFIILFQLQIYELFLKRQRKRKKNTQKIAVAMYEIAVPMCEIAVPMCEIAVAG
jgi:predicted RecB family nuclease